MSTFTGSLNTVGNPGVDALQVYIPESVAIAVETLSTLNETLKLFCGMIVIRLLSFTAVPL